MDFTLENLGNTCYFNTTIQCLFNIQDFVAIFKKNNSSGGEITQLLSYLIDSIDKKNQDEIHKSLKDLLVSIQSKMENKIRMFSQNDMCEFLLLFFDVLVNEIKVSLSDTEAKFIKHDISKAFGRINSKTIRNFNYICASKWVDHFRNDYNRLDCLTSFMSVSQIKCRCSKLHHNYEFNNTLQLDITECSNLYECMNGFVRSVYFNESDNENTIEWTCDACNERQLSKKVTTFWQFPKLMIIFLKRFVMKPSGRFVKQNHEVYFPEEIDLNKYILNSCSSTNYKLKSIGCHVGKLNFGHYYAILKKEDDTWFRIDDEDKTEIKDIHPKAYRDGYMLVYEQD